MSLRPALVTLLLLLPAGAAAGPPAGGRCPYSTQECLDMMTKRMKSGGFIGVELDADEKVYRVTQVYAGSPAEKAGIRPGDVLAALNGVAIPASDEKAVRKARGEWVPGQQVTYTVLRDGAPRQVTLTLAPWPADVLARQIGRHMMEHASIASSDPPGKPPVP